MRKAAKATSDRTPIIHECIVNEDDGMLTIESDNIQNLTVKYYMIDNEVLFSRAPFVKDEAIQFSYVKPYHELV